jgi:predicted CoA-binding protein
VDMVDIFRPAEDAPELVEEAIKTGAKVFWMQLGIRHAEAAKRAEEAGLQVVMDRCPKIEYARLTGELGWNGINTGVISNRRKRF